MSNDTTEPMAPDPPRSRLARWLAVPVLAISGVMVGTGPADASHDIVPVETREVFDVLRLRCVGNDGDVAEVACRWTMPEDAVGVKVLRVAVGSGQGRETVFRTDDPSINRFVDSPVRRGVRYLYVVRAFDSAGNLVAASRPAVAGVALAPEPTIEVLRLECAATGEVSARCRWSTPGSAARVLTLWRSVDGGARERVASFGSPFPSSYGDTVPSSSSRAVYAVIATDGDGAIVARSRADGVAFPRPDVRVDPASPEPTVTTATTVTAVTAVPTPPADERSADSDSRPTPARNEPSPTTTPVHSIDTDERGHGRPLRPEPADHGREADGDAAEPVNRAERGDAGRPGEQDRDG